MTTITDSDSWLDMRVGETATVLGRFDGINISYATLQVSFADWSTTVINCRKPNIVVLQGGVKMRDYVNVRVERTEDGLEAIALWKPNSVPIPLRDAVVTPQRTTVS